MNIMNGVRPEAVLVLAVLALVLLALAWARSGLKTLRAQAAALKAENEALQNTHGAMSRELSLAQASEAHLRERLDEARARLQRHEYALQEQQQRYQSLEKKYVELQVVHSEKQYHTEHLLAALDQSRAQLKVEFHSLADRILEEKGKSLADSSQTSLEALLRPFREQIESFQQRVNHIHDESLRGNVSLSAEIKRVADMGLQIGQEASTLATALRGEKKTMGNWGEVQLERTLQLAGLLSGDHYVAQPRYNDKDSRRRHPDFVVHLPDGKHLVIDSKVSLVDYDRAVCAETPDERREALDGHVRAVRHHVDDLAEKDYSNLNGLQSPSFVFMYMPIEAAYIEALRHDRGLYEYAWGRNVVLVSHTTLLPVLKTVANVWTLVRSNEQAHALSEHAGELYNQVALAAERLKRLGATLSTASRHYNETVTAVAGQQGLFGKVARFTELSSRAKRTLPELDMMSADFHDERLDIGLHPKDE